MFEQVVGGSSETRTRDVSLASAVSPDAKHAPPSRFGARVLLLVLAGGMIGTGLRYGIEEFWRTPPDGWPWATWWINIIGAACLSALSEFLALRGGVRWSQSIRLSLGTGLCGAFTTYSTFSLEVVMLGRHHQYLTAGVYALSSVVAGIVAAWVGIAVVAFVTARIGGAR